MDGFSLGKVIGGAGEMMETGQIAQHDRIGIGCCIIMALDVADDEAGFFGGEGEGAFVLIPETGDHGLRECSRE